MSPVDKGPGINGLAQENLGNNPVDESGQAHGDGNGGHPGGNCNNILILTRANTVVNLEKAAINAKSV
jgi:hypothetical protein